MTPGEGGWRFGENAVGRCPSLGAEYGMFIDMQTAWKGLEWPDCLATRPPLFLVLTHLAHLLCPLKFFFFNHLFCFPFLKLPGDSVGACCHMTGIRAVREGGDVLSTLAPIPAVLSFALGP